MHRFRVQALVVTILAIAMTVTFVVVAWREPDRSRFALLFAPLFGFASGMGALSVFLPNSWYRHRERVMKRHEHTTA
jgi:uncharacterized membrane protein YccC